ncbi:unnamed protein product, partial [Owenia fusiformis]
MVDVKKATWIDYVRFILSALLLLFSLVVTFYAIVERKTGFWKEVPGWVALILFIIDLFLLGIVEGLQIALVELKRQHPDSYKKSHPAAYRLGQIAAHGDNVERFLIGRQVFVVILVFFCAKLTTIHANTDGGKFLFPVPFWFQAAFLETGLLACIIVVTIAQLMPQIVAAKYPVHFLQIVIMRPAYYACVFVEITGIAHICWLLAAFFEFCFRWKDDESTVNPNDILAADEILNEIEGSLSDDTNDSDNTPGDSTSVDMGDNVEKQPLVGLHHKLETTKYTHLVDKLNNQVEPDTLRILRHYLDNHPEKFHKFPSMIGGKIYPAPGMLA